MATGGKDESEDSGYLEIKGATNASTSSEKKLKGDKASMEMTDLNAIKKLNKNLNEKIKSLKQEINNQTTEFGAEKLQMIRNHRRETDHLKRIHKGAVERLASKSQEIEKHLDEIRRLKATIESLEQTEKELRGKIGKVRYDERHRHEYENQLREMSASEEEIRRLKEQVSKLENIICEQDEEITKRKATNADLSKELGNLAKKHEDDMTAMKSDLIDKMDEKEKNTIEMFKNLENLIIERTPVQNAGSNPATSPQFEQNKTPLPPISSRSPPKSNSFPSTKPSWRT